MTDLERLLANAAVDPAQRPEFTRALMSSEVYVLGSLDRPAIGGKARPGSSMNLVTWRDGSGPITPFFTSEASLRRTLAALPGTDSHFLRLPASELFAMVRGQRMVLDPHGEHSKEYTASEIDAMLGGREPGVHQQVVERDRQVMVGAAASVPPELPRVLGEFLAKRPGIHAAHLGWIAHPDDGHQGFLMIVVADDRDAAMSGFGSLQIGEVTGGPSLDVLVVPPGKDHFLANVPPFFTKSDGG